MLGKFSNKNQGNLFYSLLKGFIDLSHKLVFLGNKIGWTYFEHEFIKYYPHTGTCKDCEFRYMCPDNRIPLKKDNNTYYHDNSCNYDPYSNIWQN